MATPKQQKFIKLLLENMGNKNSTKTLGEMLLESGYTKSVADNPYLILETKDVREATKEFSSMLEDKRRMAITHITEDKLEKSSPRDLAYITDIMTKNHQLLTGGETERVGVRPITELFTNGVQDSNSNQEDSRSKETD